MNYRLCENIPKKLEFYVPRTLNQSLVYFEFPQKSYIHVLWEVSESYCVHFVHVICLLASCRKQIRIGNNCIISGSLNMLYFTYLKLMNWLRFTSPTTKLVMRAIASLWFPKTLTKTQREEEGHDNSRQGKL